MRKKKSKDNSKKLSKNVKIQQTHRLSYSQRIHFYYRYRIKRKWSNFISKFKNNAVKPFLYLIRKYKIKEDFCSIYNSFVFELYNNPKFINRTLPDKDQWYIRAKSLGANALIIDPHQKVTDFLKSLRNLFEGIDNLWSKFQYIVYIIIVLLFSGSFLSFFNVISNTLFQILCILFILSLLLGLYLRLLNTDTDFFHIINKKMIFTIKDLFQIKHDTRNDKTKLIVATIWNGSLNDYRTSSRLLLMLLVKIFRPKLYSRIMSALKEDLPKHFEELESAMKENKHKEIYKRLWRIMRDKPK